MVDSGAKVQALDQVLNLITCFLMVLYVFLVSLRLFCSKLALNYVWKRIRYLRFTREDSTNERRSLYINCIDRPEICGIKAAFDEGLDVKL